MKSFKVNFPFLILLLSFFISCTEKEEELELYGLNLGGETWTQTAIDNWLSTNYVTPYNIEIKYRFDRYELALNKMLVPPMESKIVPVMEAIRKTWIEPYNAEAGPHFIKKLSPKQFVLVGSAQYNSNRTITLGTAEGGRKIVLFKINDFDKKNKAEVKQMLHTIHHEFAHILHQTIMYPQEFKRITTNYTASWNDYSLADARSRGFITEYARSNPDDDFVEMISIMLIEGRSGFNAIVNNAPANAQPLLRKKEQLVASYFKNAWNIDIYSLQNRAEAAIDAL